MFLFDLSGRWLQIYRIFGYLAAVFHYFLIGYSLKAASKQSVQCKKQQLCCLVGMSLKSAENFCSTSPAPSFPTKLHENSDSVALMQFYLSFQVNNKASASLFHHETTKKRLLELLWL